MIPHGFTLFQQDLDHVASALEDDWDRLRGARIFITGGTGYFGMALVEALLWANETRGLGLRLTILSRDPQRFLETRATHLGRRDALGFVAGQLTDFQAPVADYTHILHVASEPNLSGEKDWARKHLASAIGGTQRLIELAQRCPLEAMLVTSSGAIYPQMDVCQDDRWVEGPTGIADYMSERMLYGQSKRMIEIMTAVAAEQSGFRALIARCFAFVGPYLPLDSNYAIGNFIRDSMGGREIQVNGDGTPLRSYLYSADLAVWLLRILARGRSGVPYNVGGDEALSIGDLARLVAAVGGRPDAVVIKGKPVPGAKPSAYLPSLTRTKAELGLEVAVPLREAVRRTMDWNLLRQNRSTTNRPGPL